MLNKVILIGNVGSDPDIRTMPNGGRVANFSLATSEFWTDKNGERQSRTEWHRICIYSEGLVKLVEKAVHKGSKLYVEGMIKSRKYTSQQDGIERNIVEIVLQGYDSTIKLLDSKPQGDSSYNNYTSSNQQQNIASTNNDESGIDNEINDTEPVDDDIPF